AGDVGQRRLPRQLERPVVPPVGRFPLRAVVDPVFDRRHFGRGQRGTLGGHRGLLEPRDAPVETALVGGARNDGRSAHAALQRGVAAAQVELAALHGLAVARRAAARGNGLDLVGEGYRGGGSLGGLCPHVRVNRGGGQKGDRNRRDVPWHRRCLPFREGLILAGLFRARRRFCSGGAANHAVGLREDVQLARAVDGDVRVGATVTGNQRAARQVRRRAAALVIHPLGDREHRLVDRVVPADLHGVHRRQRLGLRIVGGEHFPVLR